MITVPTAPSEFGTSVDDLAAAYSPQELQKRYRVTKELVYLLALQKLKSEMDAAQRSLAMSQQQTPGTVKQQLENQVMQGKMQEASGIMSQMEQMAQRQPQMAAQGGIMRGFREGGVTQEEIDSYRRKANPRQKARVAELSDDEIREIIQNQKRALDVAKTGLVAITGGPYSPLAEAGTFGIPRPEDKGDYSPEAGVLAAPGETLAAEVGKDLGVKIPEAPDLGPMRKGLESIETASTERGDSDTAGISAVNRGLSVEDALKKAQELDIGPKVDDSILQESRRAAAVTPEELAEQRKQIAEDYVERRDPIIKRRQEAVDKEMEVLEGQLDPDELRRQRRMAFFGGASGSSVGSLLRSGLQALQKTEKGQREFERLVAKTRKDGVIELEDINLNTLKEADAEGLAYVQIAENAKQNAIDRLTGLSETQATNIVALAGDILSNATAQERAVLDRLQLIAEKYSLERREGRAAYSTALDGIEQMIASEQQLRELVKQRPEFEKLRIYEAIPKDALKEEELKELAELQTLHEGAVQKILRQNGNLQVLVESYKQVIRDFEGGTTLPKELTDIANITQTGD